MPHGSPNSVPYGVVLACGSSLDRLTDDDFAVLCDRRRYITVGVNRICLSAHLQEADYTPDYLLVWDPPRRDSEASNLGIHRSLNCAAAGGATRVVVETGPRSREWPADCRPIVDRNWKGGIHGIQSIASAGDAAVNWLYRLGCRRVYLAGVDLAGPYCRWVDVDHGVPENPWTNPDVTRAHASEWRRLADLASDLELYCLDPGAVLVQHGIAKPGRLE